MIIQHYVTIWSDFSSSTFASIHGDLSLEGNVIFTEHGPFIIDWEHYINEGTPIGFDALYLMFEALYYNGVEDK